MLRHVQWFSLGGWSPSAASPNIRDQFEFGTPSAHDFALSFDVHPWEEGGLFFEGCMLPVLFWTPSNWRPASTIRGDPKYPTNCYLFSVFSICSLLWYVFRSLVNGLHDLHLRTFTIGNSPFASKIIYSIILFSTSSALQQLRFR